MRASVRIPPHLFLNIYANSAQCAFQLSAKEPPALLFPCQESACKLRFSAECLCSFDRCAWVRTDATYTVVMSRYESAGRSGSAREPTGANTGLEKQGLHISSQDGARLLLITAYTRR